MDAASDESAITSCPRGEASEHRNAAWSAPGVLQIGDRISVETTP